MVFEDQLQGQGVERLTISLIEILLRLSTAKYWSESLLISVRIAVLDISNDQKKL